MKQSRFNPGVGASMPYPDHKVPRVAKVTLKKEDDSGFEIIRGSRLTEHLMTGASPDMDHKHTPDKIRKEGERYLAEYICYETEVDGTIKRERA